MREIHEARGKRVTVITFRLIRDAFVFSFRWIDTIQKEIIFKNTLKTIRQFNTLIEREFVNRIIYIIELYIL